MQRKFRLRKKQDFKKVYSFGKSIANRSLVLYIRNNKAIEDYRFGISVSKKIGKAVERNRVKRLIKESLSSLIRHYPIKKNVDVVFIARQPVNEMNFKEIQSSVEHLLLKSKIIEKEK